MKTQPNLFGLTEPRDSSPIPNIASVPQRSPFRYAGGKTWLVPRVRLWLKQSAEPAKQLIEPFAGGGIVGLTAAFERLAQQVTMVELDEEVAAVWQIILGGEYQWLAQRILNFDLNADNVRAELERPEKSLRDLAFCTILKNRVFHGGILAKGSGMIKQGENGKGLTSRWYPKTLHDRIMAIGHIRQGIHFQQGDGFELIEENLNNAQVYLFLDPPYVLAGKRLYTHFELEHERLFALCAQFKGKFMLTYDDHPEIRQLAAKYHLDFRTMPMKTTHHLKKQEIILSDNFTWWPD